MKAFKERCRWAVALVAIFIGASVAMLYVNRPRWALFYLIFDVMLLIGVDFLIKDLEVLFSAIFIDDAFGVDAMLQLFILIGVLPWVALAALVVPIVHAVRSAKYYSPDAPKGWYAKPPAIVVLACVSLTLGYGPFIYEDAAMVEMKGDAMAPGICEGETLFPEYYVGLFPWFGTSFLPLYPGDVAMVEIEGERHVSRVIAQAGDVVQIIDGRLVVNDAHADAWPVEDEDEISDIACEEGEGKYYVEELENGAIYYVQFHNDSEAYERSPRFVVPENSYYLLSDQRDLRCKACDEKGVHQGAPFNHSLSNGYLVHEDDIVALIYRW